MEMILMGEIFEIETLEIDYINIYAYIELKKKKEGTQKDLIRIKSLLNKNIKNIDTDNEIENKSADKKMCNDIKNNFKQIMNKKSKIYDYHKGRDEIFEIKIENLKKEERLEYILKRLEERDNGSLEIEECKKFPENIHTIIFEINLKNNGKFYFFSKYSYKLLKRATLLTWKEKFEIYDNDVLVINSSPDCILHKDTLYILREDTQSIFDFKNFFDETLEKNIDELKEVFEDNNICKETFGTKSEKFYMSRGIMTGGLKKYKNLSTYEKKDLISKFEKGYSIKKNTNVNIIFKNDKIDFSVIVDSELRIALIQYITNKSAWKSIDNMLTLSVD
jgi:hypothetical protein